MQLQHKLRYYHKLLQISNFRKLLKIPMRSEPGQGITLDLTLATCRRCSFFCCSSTVLHDVTLRVCLPVCPLMRGWVHAFVVVDGGLWPCVAARLNNFWNNFQAIIMDDVTKMVINGEGRWKNLFYESASIACPMMTRCSLWYDINLI